MLDAFGDWLCQESIALLIGHLYGGKPLKGNELVERADVGLFLGPEAGESLVEAEGLTEFPPIIIWWIIFGDLLKSTLVCLLLLRS
jgi:hypothetical protein